MCYTSLSFVPLQWLVGSNSNMYVHISEVLVHLEWNKKYVSYRFNLLYLIFRLSFIKVSQLNVPSCSHEWFSMDVLQIKRTDRKSSANTPKSRRRIPGCGVLDNSVYRGLVSGVITEFFLWNSDTYLPQVDVLCHFYQFGRVMPLMDNKFTSVKQFWTINYYYILKVSNNSSVIINNLREELKYIKTELK